jgi:dienelactone hydrolase
MDREMPFGHPVVIPLLDAPLAGALGRPAYPKAAAVIGADHASARRQHSICELATALRDDGFAVLLVDLLTSDEQADEGEAAKLRRDPARLAARLRAAEAYLRYQRGLGDLPLACVGIGAGAAAALVHAGSCPSALQAVVGIGGHPADAGVLAGSVEAATLLLGLDEEHHEPRPEWLGAPVQMSLAISREALASGDAGRIALAWLKRHTLRAAADQSAKSYASCR